MKCNLCEKKAVILNPSYCKEHFIDDFEKKVEETIKQFNLFNKNEKILVATSGGKDSLTVLHILKKLGYNVKGLLIDEGIKNYREYTIDDMNEFSKKYDIDFVIKSFEEEYSSTLDDITKKTTLNPCHICGIFRRQLLNKYSKEYDVIATGHNLDDEAQSILMNLLKSQTNLLSRLGPITGLKKDDKFTRRVKPLYLLSEKNIRLYTFLLGLKNTFTECPYSSSSFRNEISIMLNELENENQGTKSNIVNHFLKNQDKIKKIGEKEGSANLCYICNEPSSGKICNACNILKELKLI
ncbi:TIGR00269 family protein [Candidatus Woesearchaeota archaeon]|nr:MAG: TIGR00269 family protein [Candidatus Woesearchaeota archaeon]